jgi:serine/threonine-protein kinase HipA
LRLVNEGERGAYILKPTPSTGKNTALMPANEHLTMQMARQVFEIETAENALIFFQNEQPAYLTKRFDLKKDGSKWAKEDFASLAGRTPQTHGAHYKYQGNYLELFHILKNMCQLTVSKRLNSGNSSCLIICFRMETRIIKTSP